MKKIGRWLRGLCTVFGALVLSAGLLLVGIGFYNSKRVVIEDNSVLMINFADSFTENRADSLWDELLGKPRLDLQALTQAIEMAAVDKRIHSLAARIDVSNLDLAQIQDVARAIHLFKASGKKTYVFSQGFGVFGQGNREYYLASFFDEIYMQPHTTIGLTGLSIEVPFMRKTLNKIGVLPEFYTRYEYKTAMASFTDVGMSSAYQEEMQRLGKGLMNELKLDISANRHLQEDFDELVNKAPLSAEDGLKANLIDGTLYLLELEDKIKEDGGQYFVDVQDYAGQIYPNTGALPTIAVLNINGIVDLGESATEIDGELTVGSQSVLADILEIADLPELKAVIVRINSPGGSYHAADEIYFGLQRLKKEKNVPIIISQSGYAASGGYFISLAGDYILAEPATITGSIGVLGGKFVLAELWQKLGISWADIKFGTNADILSMNKPFSAAEKDIFNASLDDVYQDFTAKVTENRKLTQDIDKIARGRVWTGRQALDLGLVDALGGMSEALAAAREKGGVSPTKKFKIVSYPQSKSFSEKLSELLLDRAINVQKIISDSGVNIHHLKLFKRLQYDSVLPPFNINM